MATLIAAVAPAFTLLSNVMNSTATGVFKTNLSLSAAATSDWRSNQPTTLGCPIANGKRRFDNKQYARNCLPSHADIEAEVGGRGRLSLDDYFELSKDLMFLMDGGPPRWFSPLEMSGGSRSDNSPLLLYLPGIVGVGLGLQMHHQTLGEIFDIWCLHIPVTDRSSFTDLVKLVEKTVRSENSLSPNRPIYIVGESMGGCLALAVAAHNPNIDLVLILVNPATSFSKSQLESLIPLAETVPQQLHSNLPFVLSVMTGMPLRMVVTKLQNGATLEKKVGELVQDFFSLSSFVSELGNRLPDDTFIWKLKMLRSAAAYANSRLHAVKAQTLVLSSEKDLILPSGEEGKRLHHILPNCEIRKFEDSGHNLLLEDGIDLLTIIKGASFYRRGKCLDYASDYMPPTASEFKKINESTRFFDVAVNPVMFSTLEDGTVVRGLAGIPSEGPVLFVGYHMLLGWELAPLVTRMWIEKNIMMRGIAHPMMFKKLREGKLPDISAFDTLRIMGAVPVSANNLYRLLANKSHVLLYPGGMREALHRKGEEYKLFWPEQSEFVRMAARFGAKIIPFGAVGEDDVSQMILDYNDLIKIPYFKAEIAQLTEEAVKLRSDINGEVANQAPHLPIMTPKLPGRFYYYFGKPIETEGRKKELRNREKAHEVYLEVKSSVEGCMEYLKEKREADPYRSILPRLTYQVLNGFDSQVPTFDL